MVTIKNAGDAIPALIWEQGFYPGMVNDEARSVWHVPPRQQIISPCHAEPVTTGEPLDRAVFIELDNGQRFYSPHARVQQTDDAAIVTPIEPLEDVTARATTTEKKNRDRL